MIFSSSILFLQLARAYPRTILRPSNVYTIDNPDILVVNDVGLWGVFVPTKAELDDFALLIRRVSASRLAYSSQLRTVLVLEQEISNQYLEAVSQNFHAVRYPDDNLVTLLSRRVMQDRVSKFAKGVRQEFSSRLFELEKYSKRKSELLYEQFVPIEYGEGGYQAVKTWNEELRRRSVKRLYNTGKGLYGSKGWQSGKFKEACEPLMTLSFFKDTNLNAGVVDFISPDLYEPVVLNLNFEDTKVSVLQRRSLMFQGILPVSIATLDVLPQIYDDLCTIRKQLKR